MSIQNNFSLNLLSDLSLLSPQDQPHTAQTSLSSLARLSGLPAERLLVVSSGGRVVRAEDRLEDHLSPPHWFLYSLNTPCSDLTKLNINIPDLLKVALTDTKRSLPDHIQKKMFIQGENQIRFRIICISQRLTKLIWACL